MKRTTIRGVRIIREPYEPPRGPVENLCYSIDLFDEGDNLVEVLGRLADLSVAQSAFEAAVGKHPDKRICLRDKCRVIRSSDRDR